MNPHNFAYALMWTTLRGALQSTTRIMLNQFDVNRFKTHSGTNFIHRVGGFFLFHGRRGSVEPIQRPREQASVKISTGARKGAACRTPSSVGGNRPRVAKFQDSHSNMCSALRRRRSRRMRCLDLRGFHSNRFVGYKRGPSCLMQSVLLRETRLGSRDTTNAC